MLRSAAVQYEAVIREAWRITWRFRSLWVLGLFAGSAGPSCSWTNRTGDTGTGRVVPNGDAERITEAITSFAPSGPRPEVFGDGRAAERIVDVLGRTQPLAA
jgi:hypothetical protein